MTTSKEALTIASKDLNIVRVSVETAVKSWSKSPRQKFSAITAGIHGALDRTIVDLLSLEGLTDSTVLSLIGQIAYELKSYKKLLLDAQNSEIPQYSETVLGQWINVYNKLIGLVANKLRKIAV